MRRRHGLRRFSLHYIRQRFCFNLFLHFQFCYLVIVNYKLLYFDINLMFNIII